MVWLWIWGIITATALVVEFLRAHLVTIWFAAGGLVTLFVVALAPNLNWVWQIVIFVSVVAVLLLCTRKICTKLLASEKNKVDAIIGSIFTVKNIQQNYTYHKFDDKTWRIYAVDGDKLEVGVKFEIIKALGNCLVAKRTINK